MAFETKVALAGSERHSVPGSLEGTLDQAQVAHVTVVLKSAVGSGGGTIEQWQEFAHQHGLALAHTAPSERRVVLQGTVEALSQAFSVQLAQYREPVKGVTFRARTGVIEVPTELQSSIVAVLGLDTRPIAKPHNRRAMAQQTAGSFTPLQVAQLYQFPKGTGEGQTIAIIELGGGYKTADLNAYFKGLGLTPPSVTAVAVGAGVNQPGKDKDADGEVMLDIEVAGAVAPKAKIVVYFAQNTDQGFHDAIAQAMHDPVNKPSIISISWGGPEETWTEQARNAMNLAIEDGAALGVTVTVAAGDDGASDGVAPTPARKLHVDFPASSPFALACGGTKLAGSGTNISSEAVWNELANKAGATGGGVSALAAIPTYQKSADVPAQSETHFKGRGVPDVAGDADPNTGYRVRVDGKDMVIGGTSAVAPLWAGLIAVMNQQLGKPLGFLNPTLYGLKSGFHDVTNGDNSGYKAKAGWDPCTGLGTPNGEALLSALKTAAGHTQKTVS
jgi:kumamolisin